MKIASLMQKTFLKGSVYERKCIYRYTDIQMYPSLE